MIDNLLNESYTGYQHLINMLQVSGDDVDFDVWFRTVIRTLRESYEKAFKSYLLQTKEKYPDTSDLEPLVQLCKTAGLNYFPSFDLKLFTKLLNDKSNYDFSILDRVDIEWYLRDYNILRQEVADVSGNTTGYRDSVASVLKDLGREEVDVDAVMSYLPKFPLEGVVLEGSVKEVIRVLDEDKA